MKSKMVSWIKVATIGVGVMALSACVEIKSEAKVESDAKVHFTTTYDVSKIISAMQMTNKSSGDELAKGLSCEKMNEQLKEAKGYACKDLGVGKFAVSGDFVGDASNGVTLDADKNQLSVDAIQLFKKVADLNPSKQAADATDAASAMMEKGLVPVAADQAAQYKQMGMSLGLNIVLPAEVLTIDGAAAKDIKDNTVAVNFVDIAGKDSYVITAKATKGGIWKKVLFVVIAIVLLLLATLYLMKRKKTQETRHVEPVAPKAEPEAVTQVVETVESTKTENENPDAKA